MKLWIAIFLLALVTILVIQNGEVVTIRAFFWEASVSRVVLLGLTYGMGVLTGFLVAKLPRKRVDRG